MKTATATVLGAVIAMDVLSACARNARAATDTISCSAADSIASTNSVLLPMGKYALKLVATSGKRSGSSANGWLMLREAPEAWRSRSTPGNRYTAVGTASIDMDSIDAITPGSLDSDDMSRPGVLVLQSPAEGTLLRFGADANRTDIARFDGAVMVARVRTASANAFGGVWMSGYGSRMSSGYFCAAR